MMTVPNNAIMKNYFDEEWWANVFLKNTQEMKKTCVFKNCMSKNETSEMRNNILQIIRELSRLRTDQFGYRVYVEGKQLYGKEMEKIYDSPPEINENFEMWVKRVFGKKKFGMIINRGEKFNNALSKRMAFKIQPLLKKIGTPLLGLNFTIFIGNYGWTPLGIHSDALGESVLHHHLGPGPKTMYTWDKNQYEELAGENKYNNKDIKKFLPYAIEHPFEEGDLYYMPPGEFHIGKSDELSIGLTLWFNNHKKQDLARKMMRVIIDQYLEDSEETLMPDRNPIDDLSAADTAIELYKLPFYLENFTFKELAKESFKDFRYSLYSNSGYWTSPFPKEKPINFLKEDSIVLESPFQIKYTDSVDGEQILIYVRGTKLLFNNHDCIKALIDEINKGEKVKIIDLLALLDKEWEENIGLYILQLLDKHYGIKKIK